MGCVCVGEHLHAFHADAVYACKRRTRSVRKFFTLSKEVTRGDWYVPVNAACGARGNEKKLPRGAEEPPALKGAIQDKTPLRLVTNLLTGLGLPLHVGPGCTQRYTLSRVSRPAAAARCAAPRRAAPRRAAARRCAARRGVAHRSARRRAAPRRLLAVRQRTRSTRGKCNVFIFLHWGHGQ